MACQQLFIDLRHQTARYGLTLSHNENLRRGPSAILGTWAETNEEDGRKGHHTPWVPLARLFFPQGRSPGLDSQTDRQWRKESVLARGNSSLSP